MKLEVSATAYENIISELYGIVYLLHCIAPSVQGEEGKYAYIKACSCCEAAWNATPQHCKTS